MNCNGQLFVCSWECYITVFNTSIILEYMEAVWALKWGGGWVQAWLAAVSGVSTWKGATRWIPSAWFHFHSCQTWYSGLLRTVPMAHQGWYHLKHSIRLGWSRIELALAVLIKSPWYTGGWFYVFVPVRMPPPAAASCPRDNFWTTFWISFILALTCRLPD